MGRRYHFLLRRAAVWTAAKLTARFVLSSLLWLLRARRHRLYTHLLTADGVSTWYSSQLRIMRYLWSPINRFQSSSHLGVFGRWLAMTVFLSYRWCNWSRRYGGNGFLRAIAFAAEELHGRLAGDPASTALGGVG